MVRKEILQDQWIRYFDDFSKHHEGWIVVWEVLGSDLGDQEKTTRLPLVGISADVKGRRPAIAVTVGNGVHDTQLIEKPKHVWVAEAEQPGHEAIEVESEDGTVTLVTFNHIDVEETERQLPPET